ncbi:hypothetical protein [Natrarchaeobaculum aegyptiacum]|nr:hypothetical protein [Natrarchaeobaculum aegyptiacum]
MAISQSSTDLQYRCPACEQTLTVRHGSLECPGCGHTPRHGAD